MGLLRVAMAYSPKVQAIIDKHRGTPETGGLDPETGRYYLPPLENGVRPDDDSDSYKYQVGVDPNLWGRRLASGYKGVQENLDDPNWLRGYYTNDPNDIPPEGMALHEEKNTGIMGSMWPALVPIGLAALGPMGLGLYGGGGAAAGGAGAAGATAVEAAAVPAATGLPLSAYAPTTAATLFPEAGLGPVLTGAVTPGTLPLAAGGAATVGTAAAGGGTSLANVGKTALNLYGKGAKAIKIATAITGGAAGSSSGGNDSQQGSKYSPRVQQIIDKYKGGQ